MDILQYKPTLNPVLMFTNTDYNQPYLVPETGDIVCKLRDNLIVVLGNDEIVINVYISLKDYADMLGLNVNSLTFVPVTIKTLQYVTD